MAVVETLVGRQPIFDGSFDVEAYALVFRALESGGEGPDTSHDGRYTPDGLLSAGDEGIEAFVGTKRAFCVVGPSVMSGTTPISVTPDRVVLEVRPPPRPDDAASAACRSLLDQGYAITVDLADRPDGAEPLLELASSVTIDPASWSTDDAAGFVSTCHGRGLKVIARGVDSGEALERSLSSGFDLFQGYAVLRAGSGSSSALTPGRAAALKMSARLFDAECPAGEVEEIVRGDPAMTHQLLQLAGIGRSGEMRRTVRSVREALVLVGWRRLQSWVALLLLTNEGETSEEQIAAVLMRARLCELLAPLAGCAADAGYTAGMLSTLDLVLGVPAARMLDTLPIDQEIRDAILTGEGTLGDLVADAAEAALGRPERARRSDIAEADLGAASLEALTWTVGMTAALEVTADVG